MTRHEKRDYRKRALWIHLHQGTRDLDVYRTVCALHPDEALIDQLSLVAAIMEGRIGRRRHGVRHEEKFQPWQVPDHARRFHMIKAAMFGYRRGLFVEVHDLLIERMAVKTEPTIAKRLEAAHLPFVRVTDICDFTRPQLFRARRILLAVRKPWWDPRALRWMGYKQ